MTAADRPVQRSRDARLLVIDARGRSTHAPRSRFVDFLRPGDLVVANDAATLPASLHGVHKASGSAIEVRLAAWLGPTTFSAIVFGTGDFHTRTEDRPPPPHLSRGDWLHLGPLRATVEAVLGHPRFVAVRFEGSAHTIWAGLARHGRPIQYAHLPDPLALWDVWTPIAALPVAFEPPSAGFVLDWKSIDVMHARDVAFATITLAAGISSTGDPKLDRRLPLDEPYHIPETTASAIRNVAADGGRIVAIGTTVVRALEHAGVGRHVVRAGDGIADQRIGPTTRLKIVDVILSGTHEPGGSHYEVLRAFSDDLTLSEANAELEARGYRTHEFGDSVLIEKRDPVVKEAACPSDPREDPVAAAA
jgi:S-adenosylmethionine:tRNA ribosyltransferase-isomerase